MKKKKAYIDLSLNYLDLKQKLLWKHQKNRLIPIVLVASMKILKIMMMEKNAKDLLNPVIKENANVLLIIQILTNVK
jgi:hypothetical protein